MTGLVHRSTTWTCFYRAKNRLTRCEHLNTNGAVPVNERRCEACGAPYLKSASPHHETTEEGLALRSTISAIVAAYEHTEREVRESFARLHAASESLARTMGDSGRVTISATGNRWSCSYDEDTASAAMREVRRDVWGHIVERLEIRRFMAAKEWEAFDRTMRDGEPPPVSEDFIHGFIGRLSANMPAMHERAVREVFDWLRPRCEERRTHKSNEVERIGKRVVLTRQVEQAWRANMFHMSPWRRDEQMLLALENVFCTLDGAPKVEGNRPELVAAIGSAIGGVGETRWFRFKCFKNGNLHLEFKRPDLVARINEIAGARSLRAAG